jgi:hypothetical protein
VCHFGVPCRTVEAYQQSLFPTFGNSSSVFSVKKIARIGALQEIARAATIGFDCVDLCANVARQTIFRRGAAVIGMTALSEYILKAETNRDGC